MKKGLIIFGAVGVVVLGALATPVLYTVLKTPEITSIEATEVNDVSETFSLKIEVNKKLDDVSKFVLRDEDKNEFLSSSVLKEKDSFFSSSFICTFPAEFDGEKTFSVSNFLNTKRQRKDIISKKSVQIQYTSVFSLESVSFDETFDYCDTIVKYNIKLKANRKYTPKEISYSFNGQEYKEEFDSLEKTLSIPVSLEEDIFRFGISGFNYENSSRELKSLYVNYSSLISRQDYERDIVKEVVFPSGLFNENDSNDCQLKIQSNKYGVPKEIVFKQDNSQRTINVENYQKANNFYFITFPTNAKEKIDITSIKYGENINYPSSFSTTLEPENLINENKFSLSGDKKVYDVVNSTFSFSVGRQNTFIELNELSLSLYDEGNLLANFDCDVSTFSSKNGTLSISENNTAFHDFISPFKNRINKNMTLQAKTISLEYLGINYSFSNSVSFVFTFNELELSFYGGSQGFNYNVVSENQETPLTENNGIIYLQREGNTLEKPKLKTSFSLNSPVQIPQDSIFNFRCKYKIAGESSERDKEISVSFANSADGVINYLSHTDGNYEYRISLSFATSLNNKTTSYVDLSFANQPQNNIVFGKTIGWEDGLKSKKIQIDFIEKNLTIKPDFIATTKSGIIYDKANDVSQAKNLLFVEGGSLSFALAKNSFTNFYSGTPYSGTNYNYTDSGSNFLLNYFDIFQNIKETNFENKEFYFYSHFKKIFSFKINNFNDNQSLMVFNQNEQVNFNFIPCKTTVGEEPNQKTVYGIGLEKDVNYNNFVQKFSYTQNNNSISKIHPYSLEIENELTSQTFEVSLSDEANSFFTFSFPEDISPFKGKIKRVYWSFKQGNGYDNYSLFTDFSSPKQITFLGENFAKNYVKMSRSLFYLGSDVEDDKTTYYHTPLYFDFSSNSTLQNLQNDFLARIRTIYSFNDNANFLVYAVASIPRSEPVSEYYHSFDGKPTAVVGNRLQSWLTANHAVSKVKVTFAFFTIEGTNDFFETTQIIYKD